MWYAFLTALFISRINCPFTESLEAKIQHFVKRQRIEVLDEPNLENST